jgi:phosphatidylglycerophosphate synthase
MRARLEPHAANVLTALRVLLTPAFVVLVTTADGHIFRGVLAVVVFAAVAASDVVDGRLARRFGSVSPRGRVFDHLSDITFVLIALGTYVALRIAPWWVPLAIAIAFGTYVINAWVLPTAHPPSPSAQRIGHAGGVCNYVLIGILVCNNSAAIHLLSADVLRWFFLLVPMYSGAAVVAGIVGRRNGVVDEQQGLVPGL